MLATVVVVSLSGAAGYAALLLGDDLSNATPVTTAFDILRLVLLNAAYFGLALFTGAAIHLSRAQPGQRQPRMLTWVASNARTSWIDRKSVV